MFYSPACVVLHVVDSRDVIFGEDIRGRPWMLKHHNLRPSPLPEGHPWFGEHGPSTIDEETDDESDSADDQQTVTPPTSRTFQYLPPPRRTPARRRQALPPVPHSKGNPPVEHRQALPPVRPARKTCFSIRCERRLPYRRSSRRDLHSRHYPA